MMMIIVMGCWHKIGPILAIQKENLKFQNKQEFCTDLSPGCNIVLSETCSFESKVQPTWLSIGGFSL